jgi:antitoxin component of MazEF toxin-antitoxin module
MWCSGLQYMLFNLYRHPPMHRKPRYTLDELVNQITEANRHEETDMGKPVGREII